MAKQVIAVRRSAKPYFIGGAIVAALIAVILGLSIWQFAVGQANVPAIVFTVLAVACLELDIYVFIYGARLNNSPQEFIYAEDGKLYVYYKWQYVDAPVNELGEVSLLENKKGFSHARSITLQRNKTLQLHVGNQTLLVQDITDTEDALKKLTELKEHSDGQTPAAAQASAEQALPQQ